jgi:hypothetical protein
MKPAMHYDISKLNSFVKGIAGAGKMYVKIGVLGAKVTRQQTPGEGLTNAEIGLKHEKGSFAENIPQRSFLAMPLHEKTEELIALTKKVAQADIEKGNIKAFLQKMGVACEQIIGEAFDTRGFGKWKPLTPFTIQRKIQNNPMPLINTRQLQRSVTSRVESVK